jgi:hypothetical protein
LDLLTTVVASNVDNSNGNQDRPSVPQRGYERYSVPIPIVATYTERDSLSRKLVRRLQRPFRGTELAHGVAVIGLGGTGKTQLVLRYIEKHKAAYDAVFWIDAQNEGTARSSFEHCCQQLNLPIQGHTDKKALHDSPFVHMFFHWLACRGKAQEWLVVVDGADDLTWAIRALIPKGRMGTVIVTSHDRDASTLLSEKSEIINVDAMTSIESWKLLRNVIDSQWSYVISKDTDDLLATTAEHLDKLPLAIDLVGRRIRTVARSRQVPCGSDGEESLKSILRDYLNDLKLHRRELLGDTRLSLTPSYQKTVWTVWETSLASLQKFERHPAQLLSLMAQLGGTDTHSDLFWGASSGLSTASEQLGIKIPSWLGEMLRLKDDGTWDHFVYREAVDILQRFGLVRPSPAGTTMHGLVKWRAAEDATSPEEWTWFLLFIVAVAVDLKRNFSMRIIEHLELDMLTHLPTTTDLIKRKTCLSGKGLVWAWMSISSFLEKQSRWTDCEELHEAVLSLHSSSLGEMHATTASSKLRLEELRARREKNERALEKRPRGGGYEKIAETGPALISWAELAVRNRRRSYGGLKPSYGEESKASYGGESSLSHRRPSKPSNGGLARMLGILDESQSVSDPNLKSRKSSRKVESKRPSRKERAQPLYATSINMAEMTVPDERQSKSDSAFQSKKSSNILGSKRPSTKQRARPSYRAHSSSSETDSWDESDSESDRSMRSKNRVSLPEIRIFYAGLHALAAESSRNQ